MPGGAFLDIPDAAAVAAGELERATELYMSGPEPGETHGYGQKPMKD